MVAIILDGESNKSRKKNSTLCLQPKFWTLDCAAWTRNIVRQDSGLFYYYICERPSKSLACLNNLVFYDKKEFSYYTGYYKVCKFL